MDFPSDLYEYDADYIGRKTYVSVRGHSGMVPKYKTYKGADGYNYIHPNFGGTWDGVGDYSTTILPDKLEYVSPIDGTHVTSRSTHREHMLRHGVVEAGDMKMGSMRPDNSPMGGVAQDVMRSIQELRSR